MSISTQLEFNFVFKERPYWEVTARRTRVLGERVVLPTYSASDIKPWKPTAEALADMKAYHDL